MAEPNMPTSESQEVPATLSANGTVFVMRVDGLDTAAVAAWTAVLGDAERDRAARFVFERNRVEYTAAHALARQALADATGHAPAAFRFEAGAHGKPTAWVGDRWAGCHFSLSHTAGLVAVAVAPFEHGFDVEALDRVPKQDIAQHYFCPPEIAWLQALPEGRQGEGFIRLWTLKEAFIKATGLGLSQALDSFWFEVSPPAIHFEAPLDGDPAAWRFEQRVVDGKFLAALGFRRPSTQISAWAWRQVEPADLSALVGTQRPLPGQLIGGAGIPERN
jgi:4'-phosphopantetheinyl transferase